MIYRLSEWVKDLTGDAEDPRYARSARKDFEDAEDRAGESLGMILLVLIFATLTLGVALLFA